VSFGSPVFLLVLLVVPLVAAAAVAVRRGRGRHPVAFTNLDLLALVGRPRRSTRRWLPAALIVLALACAATALARPRIETTVADGHAVVVILVDVSGSMQANDIPPSRIAAAESAMQTFVERLPPQASVGLVEFSTDPTTVELPTTDHNTVEAALSLLAPEGATALGDGLGIAIQDVKAGLVQSHATQQSGRYVPGAIVLESDGAQNRGTLQPLEAAQRAKAAGIRIYTVAFGTPHGKVSFVGLAAPVPVPPDPATMQAIARITGGKTYTAETAQQATSIYGQLGSTIARNRSRRDVTSWLSLGACILLLAAVAIGISIGPALP
jgi:Ca-activated chloride channel family protein